jgi:fatty-acyl-CoA synthase
MRPNDRSLQSLLGIEDHADPAFVLDGTPVSRAEFSRRVDQAAAWLAA